VGVDSAGKARFSWTTTLGVNRVVAERGLAGSILGNVQHVSFADLDAQHASVAVGPNGTAAFAWMVAAPDRLQARRRLADGSLGPVLDLAPATFGADPQVAVDQNGAAVFAWLRLDGSYRRVQTRVLKADGTLTPVQTLSGSGQNADRPQLEVAPNGDATFAWERFNGANTIVQTRTRVTSTGTLTPVQPLSASGRNAAQPRLAVDGGGDATFAWTRNDGANYIIQTRRRTAAGTLGAVQDLSAPGHDAEGVAVAVDPGDDASFAWQRSNGANLVIETRTRKPDGTLSPVEPISAVGQTAHQADVGIDTAGNATFGWLRSDGATDIAQARRRTAGGAFGLTMNLSAPGAAASDVHVATAPGGDAVFVWKRASVIQGLRYTAAGSLGSSFDVSN
jgi:hypothetical protein